MDVVGKANLAFQEKLMIVTSLIQTTGEAIESVEIELPLKACHLGLLEVLGHDMINKLLCLVNNEASSMRLPRNHVTISIGLDHVQHGMKFDRERSYHTTLGLVLDRLWIDGRVSGMVMVIMLDYLRIRPIVTMRKGSVLDSLWCVGLSFCLY
jgi:hypothetical protein